MKRSTGTSPRFNRRLTLLGTAVLGLVCALFTSRAFSQTSSTVEALGTVSASQAADGLGFNVNPQNEWEFQMAQAAGATTIRFQCGWTSVETQSLPPSNTNTSTQFVLPADCEAGLTFSKKYGMRPTVLAAYGSPFHPILALSVPAGAKAGATTLNVQFASGVGGDTLKNIVFPYDTIQAATGNQITNKHSYAGGLITGVTVTDATHATLTLASALTSSLPANASTLYTVNEYLYPPAATFSPTDPSVLAFAKYAEFLASSIAAEGLKGEVEIWNEPPWPDDPWDERADYYDVFPGTSTTIPQPYMPNFGFIAAIQSQASPAPGVTYVWGGTEKSGASSVFNWMQQNTGVKLTQPAQVVTTESMHPYGNTPEDGLWLETCLKATVQAYPAGPNSFAPCNIFGVQGGNAALGEQFSLVQAGINSSWGVHREITETGFAVFDGDAAHKARFAVRQFLGYQAEGVTPIEFYRLWDQSASDWGFVAQAGSATAAHAAYPAYTAISGVMADLGLIKQAPVAAYSASTLPSVQSYSGTYPLDVVELVGSKTGDTANSVFLALWQRSNGANWGTITSPAAAPVTVQIPTGLSVRQVVNLDTRATVASKVSGQTLTVSVSDDPVEVLLVPVSVASVSMTASASSVVVGSNVTLTCTAKLVDGSSSACTTPTFASSNSSVSRMTGNVAAAEGVGSAMLTATAGGMSASAPLTVTSATPTITFNAIPQQVVGGPLLTVSATSGSFGAMTYSIVSGPATISGQVVKTTGAGTVVVKAVQAAAGNYGAGQGQTSFNVIAGGTSLSLTLSAATVSSELELPGNSIQIVQKGNNWPTGTIQILDNSNPLWSFSIAAGNHGRIGGISLPSMSVGQHSLTLSYGGDANYPAGVSPASVLSVVASETAISGTCASTNLTSGQSLSCTVTGTLGSSPLGGVVDYTANGVTGTVALNASGKGSIVVPSPAKGAGTLTLRYLAQGQYPGCPYAVNVHFTVN